MSLFWASNACPSALISVFCCSMDVPWVFRWVEMSLIEDVVLVLVFSSALRCEVVSLMAAVIAVFWATDVDTLEGRLDMGWKGIGWPV